MTELERRSIVYRVPCRVVPCQLRTGFCGKAIRGGFGMPAMEVGRIPCCGHVRGRRVGATHVSVVESEAGISERVRLLW